MSVLDTFYILFKSDASDVEKGTKKAKESVDGLEGGISGADKKTVQLGKKFNSLATQALAAFASVAAVTQLISSASGVASQATQLGVLSDVLGESASEIVNWGRAVQGMGGDAKAFEGSMKGLAGSLNDALISGPNAATDALAKMGISARDAQGNMKTVLDILPDLAGEFSGLTRESALARGKSLGLDEGTILLLMKGKAAVEGLVGRQREMNTVSDEEIDNLRKLKARWDGYKNAMSDAQSEIISALLPAFELIESGFKSFAKLIAENQGTIMTFFKGVGVLVAALAIKAMILALPFILTVAAISAVAFAIGLLIEDIYNFVTGQQSVLGDAAERWSFIGDAIEFVKAQIANVVDLFKKVADVMSGLSLPDIFGGAMKGASGFFDMIDSGYKKLTGADIEGVQGEIGAMTMTPLSAIGAQASAGGAGSSSSSSSSVSIGELTIETQASDPAAIAATITSELETHLSNAVEQNDDGIAA